MGPRHKGEGSDCEQAIFLSDVEGHVAPASLLSVPPPGMKGESQTKKGAPPSRKERPLSPEA